MAGKRLILNFRGLLFEHIGQIWLQFTLCLWEFSGALLTFSRALFAFRGRNRPEHTAGLV